MLFPKNQRVANVFRFDDSLVLDDFGLKLVPLRRRLSARTLGWDIEAIRRFLRDVLRILQDLYFSIDAKI